MVKSVLRRFPLVFCAAATILVVLAWSRSYFRGDRLLFGSQTGEIPNLKYQGLYFVAAGGGLAIYREEWEATDEFGARVLRRQAIKQMEYRSWSDPSYPMALRSDYSIMASLGFQVTRLRNDLPGMRRDTVVTTFPYWALLALFGWYPIGTYVRSVLKRQREERLALGLCPNCGVALDAEADRCPSCAKVFAPASA